jgi:hypothetical protein
MLVLALAATASAQETITTRDLDGSPWGSRVGKPLALEGKFEGYDAGLVQLAKVAPGRLVVDATTPEGEALAGLLAGFKTKQGGLDKHGRSNVRVLGVARDGPRGRLLAVSDVVKLPDDIDRFRERAARQGADLEALAREAGALARDTNDTELAEWSRATFEAALDARKAVDATQAVALARSYRDLAHVTSKAIAVLSPHAATPEARTLLEELGARVHRGRWISYEELKTELGYVLVNGQWVTRLRAELVGEVERQRALAKTRTTSVRTLSDKLYMEAANEHRLAVGMHKPEAALAKGFPREIERFADSDGVTWEVWALEDGTHEFFTRARGDDALLLSWR